MTEPLDLAAILARLDERERTTIFPSTGLDIDIRADVRALVAEVERLRAEAGQHFLNMLIIESKVDILLKGLGLSEKLSDFKYEWRESGKEIK